MKIENIKQLKEVIQLCQKLGVEAIEIDNVKMNLTTPPMLKSTIKRLQTHADSILAPGGITEDTKIPSSGWEALTEEQRMFYSAPVEESNN